MDSRYDTGCWGFLHRLKTWRRKEQKMAYDRSVLGCLPVDKTMTISGAMKYVDYKDSSICLSQDSGYNESIKVFSPDCGESPSETLEKRSLTHQYENSENIDPSLVLSPIKNENYLVPLTCTKETNGIYETPRVIKKDYSLRRRLLLSKATSGGNLDYFDVSEGSTEMYGRKKSLQRTPSFEVNLSDSFDDSPRDVSYKPIATSTLKTEESGASCQKWRLSFAQQRSSTLDDSKCDHVPVPDVENISPVQLSTPSVTDDSILRTDENISQLPNTPTCNLIARAQEEFLTPISNLAANFSFNLSNVCTPTVALVCDLDTSVTEDSAFHSLSFDRSQDSITDHEGSFQELIQKPRDTPKTTQTKNRLRKLERCRRLSTLRERGSQSEVDEETAETHLLSSAYKSKVARESVDEENELSLDDCSVNSLLKIEDLTGTPALRVVHEMLMRSKRKRPQKVTVQYLVENTDGSQPSENVLLRLIGRKMGLEKLDILAELKYRNLKHILAIILDVLNVEGICSFWKVSEEWRQIVVEDKNANQRRKIFLKRQKAEVEQGRLLSIEDAATRLNLLNRSALRSVQAQARSAFQTPTSTGFRTPKDTNFLPQSASKPQIYLKVAKTLFTDEALKPCPRCQYPAKYQPLKKRCICSRKDCGYDFCSLCLCAFHGSKECSSGSAKRRNQKDALPGSAQSKRNLKRL
ncbi:F-box only protein 43 isoform X2 [Ascaphus truei]|uniref:F-box only protein 43 isoform X2 n=1 Tax=Ascaphus truei TaxID=8439 RepID=UPI003F59BFA2